MKDRQEKERSNRQRHRGMARIVNKIGRLRGNKK